MILTKMTARRRDGSLVDLRMAEATIPLTPALWKKRARASFYLY